MFYRLTTDVRRQDADLQHAWAGPARTPCWLIGSGPSLTALPTDQIAASPAPKFALNLAGHGLLRPTFWTSYDPTDRFHRSIFLDPSITKFVHRCRAMDLIPETTFKVCDAPALWFFDRDPQRGFHNLLQGIEPVVSSPASRPARHATIVDWQDSMIQAIAIAYHLGFRTLYLAGCEMFIRPAAEHFERAAAVGVEYREREPLKDFFDRCRRNGLPQETLVRATPAGQYHFAETKPLAAAIQTDWHYFRIAQYLRLSRRALSLAGLELISITPSSRLNDHFPYLSVESALAAITQLHGDPLGESTAGRYTTHDSRQPSGLAPMRDFPPHNWPRRKPDAAPAQPQVSSDVTSRRQRLWKAVAELPEIPVALHE